VLTVGWCQMTGRDATEVELAKRSMLLWRLKTVSRTSKGNSL
jgi:hypothetical protein